MTRRRFYLDATSWPELQLEQAVIAMRMDIIHPPKTDTFITALFEEE